MNLVILASVLSFVAASNTVTLPGPGACTNDSSSSGCRLNTLLQLDFRKTKPVIDGPDATWTYFNLVPGEDSTKTNDGVLSYDKDGATLATDPMTKWYPPSVIRELDAIKYMLTTVEPIGVPETGRLIIDWHATAKTANTGNNPFPESVLQSEDDYRLASGVFNVQSTINGSAFVFLLTNSRVYAVYRRTPYHREAYGNYYGFTYLFPIASRKPWDWHRMRIVMDANKRHVSWVLDGRKMFRVKPGYKPAGNWVPSVDFGGEEMDGWPPAVSPAFGTVTDLGTYPASVAVIGSGQSDVWPEERTALVRVSNFIGDIFAPTYNPLQGPPAPPTYWDDIGTSQGNHIWGQSVILGLKKLKITAEDC